MKRSMGLAVVLLGCASQPSAPDPVTPTGEQDETPATGEPTETPVTASSCAAVLCAVNTYCDDIGGQAKCLPLPSCVDHPCPDGQSCELVQVQCIRAPCPPQPACVPSKT
jgi:hypothetical protein